uniref:Uncharacterized protein n=1 Tax=Anguilla anguilla TaxID=7936 RepID=A0A0E9XZ45_ANGAN
MIRNSLLNIRETCSNFTYSL